MVEWDGRGLPPVAAARIARAGRSGVWTSLLSTSSAGGLQVVGLDPVGEVMGSTVEQIGWQGYGGCGINFGFGMGGAVFAPQAAMGSREGSTWSGFRPYADAIRRGYEKSMSRLMQEAAGLSADGVVGIRLTQAGVGSAQEFLALGTAVRARSTLRPRTPFATTLPGEDVVKLMFAGYVPAGLVIAFDVAIRHDDWQTLNQAGSWVNTEVTGYTELAQYIRHLVRVEADQQAGRLGADGMVAVSLQTRTYSIEPSDHHHDHVAEGLLKGTAVVQFARAAADRPSPAAKAPGRALTVLPLGGRPRGA
jgi:uncharacterized protein YbjQ (UPF0145 family)